MRVNFFSRQLPHFPMLQPLRHARLKKEEELAHEGEESGAGIKNWYSTLVKYREANCSYPVASTFSAAVWAEVDKASRRGLSSPSIMRSSE